MRRASGFCGLALLVSACGPSEPAPPSVILVSIDTLRADHMGLYGYERDTSPFLDRFARESLVFEHAFTPAAWTLVAHMTMLTGLFPKQHGVVEGNLALSSEVPTLAERLRAAGYHTLGLYRLGWIHARHGFDRGFEVFRKHLTAEEAEQHLSEELTRLPHAPFFLFLHLFDVHNDPSTKSPPSVFSAPAPYQDLFLKGARERLKDETYLTLKQKPKLSAEEREALIALYDDGIRHVDAVLERIFAKLESDGRLANTLVIVTADHGESLAQRGKLTGHGGPWQEGVHVPLIVRPPDRARAGERVAGATHLVDVVATVLDCVGLPHDPSLPGHSLLRAPPAERVLAGGDDPVEFYVRWPAKWTRVRERFGAFDLGEDPLELHPRTVTAEEFAAVREALALPPHTLFTPQESAKITDEERADLNAMGYGGDQEQE